MKTKRYFKVLKLIALIFLVPLAMNSQTIRGVIYDAESKLKDIKVFNLSKQVTTYSDDAGNFVINASINDTLVFSSLFYEQKKEVLTKDHFENSIVIELKKIMNNLDEVVLTDRSKNKEFDAEAYTTDLKAQIADDIKKNPHLYGQAPSYGLDFIAIASLIGKLFKKEKFKPDVVEPINYKQLDSLFAKDNLLNDTFLVNELKIPLEYKNLFFEYFEAQNINDTFLKEDKRILLLEELFKHSKAFKTFLSDYEKGKTKD
ncbi:carboxypeptidase-like regulatory domain-containing protein [Confluentibacter citreus]|uniref:carboxypeptidase-like regulatory domain-containing protein n=1 Tax=Confluentibacter citreus TaxID=2007307 RepID=UPI0012FD9142|nr:carboxypeptidase-like regulatory domain-containing protein [Confluentibacter citreus]